MKDFLLRVFTWWNGATFGTLRTIRRHGEFVGEDEFGNRYYRGGKKDATIGVERRWVIYKGYAEASAVPPGWNGWLRNTVALAPTEENYVPREWELPYEPNHTGTPAAYRPPGSTLASGHRPPATGDYEAWVPGN